MGVGMPKDSNVWEGYNPSDYKNLNISNKSYVPAD